LEKGKRVPRLSEEVVIVGIGEAPDCVSADLALKFHPVAIRAAAGFAPVDAVSCSA
jgi:hypothetical protein